MTQSSIPKNLEDFEYYYRRDRSLVVWTFLAGLMLGYCSYLLTKGNHSEAIFLWGLTTFVIFRAIWIMLDNTVKFCFNAEGLYSKERWTPVSEIDSYQVVERQDGVRLQHFLDLSLKDGSKVRIELSGLNKSVPQILRELSAQFEISQQEQL